MKRLVAMKNSRKKGFTLVELIVVLVILAILAAIFIPTLTKYIDKANNNALVAETRSVVIAAQTLASEAYGTKNYELLTEGEVAKLAEVSVAKIIVIQYDDNYKISYAEYGESGTTCYYAPKTGYTMTKPDLAYVEQERGTFAESTSAGDNPAQ